MRLVMRSVTSVCAWTPVCLSCSCFNFWKHWNRQFFFVEQVVFKISRPSAYIKIIGSMSRSQEQKTCLCVLLSSNLQTSFWYAATYSEHPGYCRVSRSRGQGQGHASVTTHIRGCSAFDWKTVLLFGACFVKLLCFIINRFTASCSKLLLFEGFSATLV